MQLDTFDTPAPMGNPNSGDPQPSNIDSFDNEEPILPEDLSSEKQGQGKEAKAGKETKEKSDKNQVEKLEDQEDGEEEVDSFDKEDEDAAPKEGKSEEAAKDSKSEGAKADAPKAKTVRAKVDGEALDIREDATLKVKVKGKGEIVTVRELIDAYSGEKAYGEKIASATEKEKEYETKFAKFNQEKEELVSHLETIASKLDGENPLDALNYLLEMTGRPVYSYNKKIMDGLASELEALSDMDEVERELYWKNKEVDYLKRHHESLDVQRKQAESLKDMRARVDRLREAHGITEEQFVKAQKELISELGYKPEEVSPEAVVKYVAILPSIQKAEQLVAPYIDDINDNEIDSFVSGVANLLRDYPTITDQEAITLTARKLGYEVETPEKVIEELKPHVPSKETNSKAKAPTREVTGPESFDDFDY